ncbi:PGAP1-like protein-domain-containing protein [Lentinula raphanica]|uniref:GPI inositol-deacylase n=1 Tax=Lentinula raphanica TaxID=153919 RepID=A0AA38PEG8_9AGAR|nr:PGAP1-like protein-domain-containing protein [Lentinula raphanica]KAJ3841414.1 PGAP1-like protein-domain-containing protein [Lentinula raphanica]
MFGFATEFQGIFAIAAILLFLYASQDVAENLSPQGCRMSYMNPLYIPQVKFNSAWTPLAERYSLFLYREDQWERELHGGTPVLFIPGNAGSSGQVRSIASSATRQYYSRPNVPAYETWSRNMKALDFFAADFNEDLSAFHGPTLQAQTEYCARAIAYILSLYPPNTTIIIMGHSMGGVVATSLLPSKDIAAIITMSTPHTLPPARFDQRVDEFYARNRETLHHDPTPLLSLCGGAMDTMIPSESCILPSQGEGEGLNVPYRRTVFSSALEGAWTGVGHREMVWCHQVRWRVARAAMELSMATSSHERGLVLDRWLRDGHTAPPMTDTDMPGSFSLSENSFSEVPSGQPLVLMHPRGSQTHLLSVPKRSSTKIRFTLFVSQGSVPPVSPQKPKSLRVTVAQCSGRGGTTAIECDTLQPSVHKLIPNPLPGNVFPIPAQGTDESEGVVVFEADVTTESNFETQSLWVAVNIEQAEGDGWVVGGFTSANEIINDVSMFKMLLGGTTVALSHSTALRTSLLFPKLSSNALVVYRIVPLMTDDALCRDQPLLQPLLVHSSHPSETHYFPLTTKYPHRILLHTHGLAPYVYTDSGRNKGFELVIYSANNGCSAQLRGFDLAIDWTATLGRWPTRYFTTIVCWSVGVVSLIVFEAWSAGENNDSVPCVRNSLVKFARLRLPKLLLSSYLLALLPLPESLFMGLRGEWLYAPIAPLLLMIASGLVCLSWWLLVALMWPIGKISHLFSARQRKEIISARRSTLISICFIFALIFFLIPWQVAYLCCWLIHLQSCASDRFLSPEPVTHICTAIPLLGRSRDETGSPSGSREGSGPPSRNDSHLISNRHHRAHLLLLMTWLLPLAAPVLVVWVRTLITAGLSTPFDGDHFFLNVAPFMILVDYASWTSKPLLEKHSDERHFSASWTLLLVAAVAFFVGPRKTYYVFDGARLAIAVLVLIRVGPLYWGGRLWRLSFSRTQTS